jgi:hypothetical protein
MLPSEPYNSSTFRLLSSGMQKNVSTVPKAPFSNIKLATALSSER